MQKNLILMKFGGSLITDKESNTPKIRQDALNQIAEILKNSKKKIIIVHGAGSYGHPIAKKYGIAEGLNHNKKQKTAINKTRKQVYKLNQLLCDRLKDAGIKTKTIIPSQTMRTRGPKNIESFPEDDFNLALKEQKIPVTYGDVTDDEVQGISILSGDVIMMKLAKIYNPLFTIFVMDYPGVIKGYPERNSSEIIPLVDLDIRKSIKKHYKKDRKADVTGGLVGKLECAAKISENSPCWITNLDNLEGFLIDKPLGSKVIS